MTALAQVADKIRSKNAGPFWLTIDVFCPTAQAFHRVTAELSAPRVAAALGVAPETVKRYEMPDLCVVKFSLPRPQVQGTPSDRDMHGASWALLLLSVDV